MNHGKGHHFPNRNRIVAQARFRYDEEMAELCGIISGDGNIWTNHRKYEVSITGCPKDKGYMDRVVRIVTRIIKPKVYYRIRGRGLRISIYSKSFFEFLTEEAGFNSGGEKNNRGIPAKVLGSETMRLAFIRGLFDTDGSVFTSEKKGAKAYPTIEITNECLILLEQARQVLEHNGIRTTLRKSNCGTYKIAVHGHAMVRKWMQTVGSSHPRKWRKMESIIKSFD